MTRKMNQVLAVEKGIKTRTYATITELGKATQQAALFNGFNKTYQALSDDAPPQAPQSHRVQYNAEEVFGTVRRALVELFDVTATKDTGNQQTRADVVVDGHALLTGVPATYLLFLDKQLSDLLTFVTKFTELDLATEWTKDPNAVGLYRSGEVKTHTTAKVQKPLVLYNATDKHPAQTQLITQDIVVGEWTTVKRSGALPAPTKKALMERIQRLLDAVKVALEEANSTKVDDVRTGDVVMAYIFGA